MLITEPMLHFTKNDFTESLLLSISYNENIHQLEITTEFADIMSIVDGFIRSRDNCDEDTSALRPNSKTFIKWLFSGVTNMCKTDTKYREGFQGLDSASLNYESANHRFQTVIQSLNIQNCSTGYAARIHMGSFGTLSFEFEKVSEQRLLTDAIKIDDNWQYHDRETIREINIDHPFG